MIMRQEDDDEEGEFEEEEEDDEEENDEEEEEKGVWEGWERMQPRQLRLRVHFTGAVHNGLHINQQQPDL